MAEPKIYTKNYVNGDDVISVTHGSGSIGNIYDRDKDSQWITTSADNDDTTVQIDVTFYEGETAIERTIDTLILLNHNLKDFIVYYWDGSTFQTWLTVTAEDDENSVKSLSSQTTAKLRLEMTATQVADAEKAVGELIACALTLDVGVDVEPDYDVIYRGKDKTLMLGDGSMQKVSIYWAPNRTQKYEAKVKFKFVPAVTADALQDIRETGQQFLWYPESETRPSEIFLVNWSSTWRRRYSSPYKGTGYDLEFDLKEV